jgi:hypothetical protein
VDEDALVGGPGLEQADADERILREARRQHAAGRAAADDHVVEVVAARSSAVRLARAVLEDLVVADDAAAAVELALARDAAALVVEALAAQAPALVEAPVHAGRGSRLREAGVAARQLPSNAFLPLSWYVVSWRSERPSATTYSTRSFGWPFRYQCCSEASSPPRSTTRQRRSRTSLPLSWNSWSSVTTRPARSPSRRPTALRAA